MSTNKLRTLPGTRLYSRYTGKYRRALRSSSGSKKKFSGRFTVSVPKWPAYHRQFNSRALLDRRDRARNVDSCPDPFLSLARFSDLAEFNLAVALQIRQSAKFKSPPNLPAIRNVLASVPLVHSTCVPIYLYQPCDVCMYYQLPVTH